MVEKFGSGRTKVALSLPALRSDNDWPKLNLHQASRSVADVRVHPTTPVTARKYE
jgi:hypothetical protein